MNDKIIFETTRMVVTKRLFSTPRKTYRMVDIEKITLKRSVFLVSLPIAVGSLAMLFEYHRYLYSIEQLICVFNALVLPFITWRIGTLSVTSKSLRDDDAITGYMPSLIDARKAIESVILFSTHQTHLPEADHEQP